MRQKFLIGALFPMLLFTAIIACQKSGIKTSPDVDITASIDGRVLDEAKNPVNGAAITVGSLTTTTDINGNFKINNAALNKNAAFVKVEKQGYFLGSRTLMVSAGGNNNVTIQLIPKTVSGSFSANTGGSVFLNQGGNINFPSNGIVNSATNIAYTGSVSVSAFYLNPTSPDFITYMPGDLRGITSGSEEKGLQSFGMMAVELNGTGGEKLQIAAGKTATISFPIPPAMQATAPSTIPLWYFNEATGLWKEEGSANKQGSSYVGTVSHFSFWNCDVPFELVNMEALLKDAAGNAMGGVKVTIQSTTDSGMVRSDMTDVNGKLTGLIPANKSLRMTVYNKCNAVVYSKNIGPFSSAINLGTITTTAVTGVTANLAGNILNCNGTPLTNGFVNVTSNGDNYRIAVTNGTFNITLPLCSTGSYSVSVFAYDISTNSHGDPITISGNTATTTNTNLTACGSTSNQFINYTIGTTNYLFTPPVDSISTQYYSGGSSTTINAFSMIPPSKGFYMSFSGSASTGTKTINYLNIFGGNLSVIKNGTLSVAITQYGPVGGFITGTFTGIVRDSVGVNTYPVNCSFNVKRDF